MHEPGNFRPQRPRDGADISSGNFQGDHSRIRVRIAELQRLATRTEAEAHVTDFNHRHDDRSSLAAAALHDTEATKCWGKAGRGYARRPASRRARSISIPHVENFGELCVQFPTQGVTSADEGETGWQTDRRRALEPTSFLSQQTNLSVIIGRFARPGARPLRRTVARPAIGTAGAFDRYCL
jgi:hypothetical protein